MGEILVPIERFSAAAQEKKIAWTSGKGAGGRSRETTGNLCFPLDSKRGHLKKKKKTEKKLHLRNVQKHFFSSFPAETSESNSAALQLPSHDTLGWLSTSTCFPSCLLRRSLPPRPPPRKKKKMEERENLWRWRREDGARGRRGGKGRGGGWRQRKRQKRILLFNYFIKRPDAIKCPRYIHPIVLN